MQLLDGVAYQPITISTAAKQELVIQTTLSGGTANFYIKVSDGAAFSLVTALNDVPVRVRVPRLGSYKVELTGSATVFADWG